MGGKTIYIKTIALLQIIAQLGCFVPAKSAQFRLCDKIFSRIGFNDNIEQGASSFVVEMRDMEYIMKNITPNSLVIIDELCRSTNPKEGILIAWQLSEKLIKMNGKLNDGKYYNDTVGDQSGSIYSLKSKTRLIDLTAPFVFLVTHFMELTRLSEPYYNVIK